MKAALFYGGKDIRIEDRELPIMGNNEVTIKINSAGICGSDLHNYRVLQNVFKENEFDGVFHLAAQSHPPSSFVDPLGTFEDNIMGSANLIQAITDHQPKCRLMFCSTSEVYGNVGIDERKIRWDDPLVPANPYGASKAATDLYMQERIINGKLEIFWPPQSI